MSLKDTILSADDLGETIVDVPEWDVKLLIRGMDGLTRSKVQKIATSNDPYANADILILVARDPDSGDLVFDKADREALAGKSGAAVEHVVIEAIRLSGTSMDEAEAEVEADPTRDGS